MRDCKLKRQCIQLAGLLRLRHDDGAAEWRGFSGQEVSIRGSRERHADGTDVCRSADVPDGGGGVDAGGSAGGEVSSKIAL
jgi:hypothetical protein